MKILHLRASNFYGGPERQLHFHARKALGSEFDIRVGSFTEHGEIPEFLRVIAGDNIPTHTFPVKNSYDTGAVKSLKEYLKENDIDILCTHDYRTHTIGLLATSGLLTHWIAFSRGWTGENLKVRMFHTLDKLIVRFADRIVAVSGEQSHRLCAMLIPSRKIVVAYNAIDPDSFSGIVKVNLRERFEFPDDVIIGILGGRFSPEKGQIYLVEAAKIALSQEPRLRFIMFGDGPDLEMIKDKIRQLGIADKVICPGFEKKMLGCLQDSDILINPSLSEGLPNIVLEAMAFKVPVVATAAGGVPELIEDGINGFTVPSKDSTQLAEKIVELAKNKMLQEKFKSEGFRTIIDDFSFEKQAEVLYGVYRDVCRK